MLPLVGWPPRCLLRAATGVPCPFCGMTTGVLATLHGDLGTAFAANPAAPVLVVAVALLAFGQLRGVWRRQLAERGGRVRRASWRWRWPALAGLWVFELHRFAVR